MPPPWDIPRRSADVKHPDKHGTILPRSLPIRSLTLQHQVEGAAGEMLAAGQPSAGSFTALAHNTQSIEFGPEQRDRAQFCIAPEDQPDSRGLRLTDD